MGNTVPRRTSSEAGRGAGTTGARRSKNAVITEEQPRDDVEEEGETTTRAGRPRAGGALRPGRGDGAAPPAPGGKVVTVKIVMRRKDAEALAARLNARERKARMAKLKSELRAGTGAGGCGGGGVSPAPCRVACRPRLEPIKEN